MLFHFILTPSTVGARPNGSLVFLSHNWLGLLAQMPEVFVFLENSIMLQIFNQTLGDYGFLRDTFELWNFKNFFLKIFLIAGLTISFVPLLWFSSLEPVIILILDLLCQFSKFVTSSKILRPLKCPQTPSECLKPWIGLGSIYTIFFLQINSYNQVEFIN